MTAPLQTLELPPDVAGQSLAASPCSPWLDSVLCGDNVQILSGLPSDSIDLVVTSPPYDDLRTYGGHTWDFEGVARELCRVLKPGGVIVWHPAPFPLKLAKDHVASWSKPGDIVLDPFAGSGTTLRAAKDFNRRFVGIEINPAYVEICHNRLAQDVLPDLLMSLLAQ